MEDEECVIEERECINERECIMEERACIMEERACIMEERECVTHAKDVLTSFEGMKNDEQFCDFILKIGEEEIPVHRMVLAACSKYFHAMFSHDTKETKTGRAEILAIEPSAGKQCLEFVYTGKIKFSRENPKDLIHAAELMQLHSLIDLYFEYLVENISIENCLEYMVLALTYNQNSFATIFEKFLAENFEEVIETEDFASMSRALLLECFDCLCDGTQLSEKLKWEAVTTWVKADLENRKDVFPEIFKMIKLENLPIEYIKKTISKEALVMESNECKDLVYHVVCADDEPEAQCGPGKSPTPVVAYHKESRLLHRYDMKTEKWSRVTRVPAGIIGDDSDIFSFKRQIYVGSAAALLKYCNGTWVKELDTGCDPGYCKFTLCDPLIHITTQTCLVEYNTETKTSEKYDIPPELRLGVGFMTGASNDCLYAVGGSSTGKKAIEFDFTTKTWEPICSTNYDCIDGALLFYQGKLIALGGSSSSATAKSQPISSGFEYGISLSSGATSGKSYSGGFNFGASRTAPRGLFGSAPATQTSSSPSASGSLFGSAPATQTSSSGSQTSHVEYYEPAVDKWITLPSLKENSYLGKNFKVFVHSDKLYVICSGLIEIKELEIDFGNTDAQSRTLYSSLFCFV